MTPHPRELLRQAGLTPKKSFGQNFLISERVLDEIARACIHESESAVVVEIGAGLGALTLHLLERGAFLFAIERDRDLVPILRDLCVNYGETVSVLEADAKGVDLRALFSAHTLRPRILAGNLPYQLTGPLLQRAIETSDCIERAVFMVQREVGERLLAAPSTKAYGALTVFVRAAFEIRKVVTAPPSAFFPPPNVTSVVVELTPRPRKISEETPAFRALVKAAFEQRRKTLRNAWANVDGAAEAADRIGISLTRRGETLSVEEFARVAAEQQRNRDVERDR